MTFKWLHTMWTLPGSCYDQRANIGAACAAAAGAVLAFADPGSIDKRIYCAVLFIGVAIAYQGKPGIADKVSESVKPPADGDR